MIVAPAGDPTSFVPRVLLSALGWTAKSQRIRQASVRLPPFHKSRDGPALPALRPLFPH
jgi:hypothetical protein